MSNEDRDPTREITERIQEMNSAWLEGRPDELTSFLHPDVVMALPGFSGQTAGCKAMIAGFRDFCENAELIAFEETDLQIHCVGTTAVASFRFKMVYRRQGRAHRATGRDLWVLSNTPDGWRAVWRTIVDMQEEDVDQTFPQE